MHTWCPLRDKRVQADDPTHVVSIFGFIGLAIIPMPMIFVRYGARFREKSHFAKKANELIAGMHNHTAEIAQELVEEGVAEEDVERTEYEDSGRLEEGRGA